MTALGTRELVLSIGGTDYDAEVSNVEIFPRKAESDLTTFAEAKAGGKKEWVLKFKAVQDLAEDTLWDLVWSSSGTLIACEVKPAGGEVGKPKFSGNVTIVESDGTLVGGDADASTSSRWTFDAEWVWEAKPVKTQITA